MHRERMHIDAGRDGKQNMPHMQCLAHGELRLVRLVVALAFGVVRLRAAHLAIDHGLDDLALGLAQLGRNQRRVARQQPFHDGVLAQQLGIGQLTQCLQRRPLSGLMQRNAVDVGRGLSSRGGRAGAAAGAATAARDGGSGAVHEISFQAWPARWLAGLAACCVACAGCGAGDVRVVVLPTSRRRLRTTW